MGALTLVVGIEPELSQARLCSPCHQVNNSSRIECKLSANQEEYLYPVTEYIVARSIIQQGLRRETLFADL